jgi:hypothetical protein
MADRRDTGLAVSDRDVPRLVQQWLVGRRWILNGSMPSGRRVAVVSSRQPRLLDPHGPWLQGIRVSLSYLRDSNAVALVGAGTAVHRILGRALERQAIPHVVIELPDSRESSASGELAEMAQAGTAGAMGAHLAGLPAEPKDEAAPIEAIAHTPLSDRAAIAWADEIVVLSLRTGGNLHTLLRQRLREPGARVRLVGLPDLQSKRARTELIRLGAHDWVVSPGELVAPNVAGPDSLQVAAEPMSDLNPRILPCPDAATWTYLTHTTRACTGPWPGQSHDEYVDGLIDARPEADHSAFGSLMRIVTQRRLIASSRAIRGGYAVVSLTAVPLAELPRLHVFRAHRSRWDFEPYGISVSREWLQQRGTRPVHYGSDGDWDRMPADERPFFQCNRGGLQDSSIAPVGTHVDWSVEQEWRHSGDLDLSQVPDQKVIAFVTTIAEARKLLEIGPWPVTVLEPAVR